MLSCFGRVRRFVTPWSVACQAPLSMGFSWQGYWSALPFPSPGDLPDPGIEPGSLMFSTLAGGFFTTSATWEAQLTTLININRHYKLHFIDEEAKFHGGCKLKAAQPIVKLGSETN